MRRRNRFLAALAALITVTLAVAEAGVASAAPNVADVAGEVQRAAGPGVGPVLASTVIALPEGSEEVKPAVAGGMAVYKNAQPGVSVATRLVASGQQTLVVIASDTAPTRYAFHVKVPGGGELRSGPNGSVLVLAANRKPVGSIAEPWAKAADGSKVATKYEIQGNVLVQIVSHQGAKYPVVADPQISFYWWGYTIYFSRDETRWIGWATGAAMAYYGLAGIPGLAAYAVATAAEWAYDNGYCLAVSRYWIQEWASFWVYRC